MADIIKLRRDTAANWALANPVLAIGEKGIETDTLLEKVGDGVTHWNDLPYGKIQCLSETGQSETEPMSQKAVTAALSAMDDKKANATSLEQTNQNLERFHNDFNDAMLAQASINEKSVYGILNGNKIYPSDVHKVEQTSPSMNIIHVITDSEGRMLFWVDREGNIQWIKGVPEPVKKYVNERISVRNDFIMPSVSPATLQSVPSVIQNGILGLYGKNCGFFRSDNPLIGYRWMLDNLNISRFFLTISINLFSKQNDQYIFDRNNPTDGLKKFNTVIRYCNENNIDVVPTIAYYPPYADKDGTIDDVTFYNLIDYLLDYNGTYDHKIYRDSVFYDDADTYKCKINGIKFFDEIEYKTDIHTPQEWLDLLAISVTYTKNRRNDIKTISPSSARYTAAFHHVIGALRSNPPAPQEAKNKLYSDLFDEYSLDPWVMDITETSRDILKAYAASDPENSYKKPYRSASAFSPTAYTSLEQGEQAVYAVLQNIARGCDYYSYFEPEYDQNEYYILDGNWSGAGHLYCTSADGSERIIRGNAYDDIVIGTGYASTHSRVVLDDNQVSAVSNELITNLKIRGLRIAGSQGLHVTSVAIRERDASTDKTVLWTGEQDVYVTPLILASSEFSSMKQHDAVIIYTDAPHLSTENSGISLLDAKPRYAAFCLKELCKHLYPGCIRPVIYEYANFSVITWYDVNNKPIYLLHKNKGVDSAIISLNIAGNYYATDLVGSLINITPTEIDLSHPVYIFNSNGIKII